MFNFHYYYSHVHIESCHGDTGSTSELQKWKQNFQNYFKGSAPIWFTSIEASSFVSLSLFLILKIFIDVFSAFPSDDRCSVLFVIKIILVDGCKDACDQ